MLIFSNQHICVIDYPAYDVIVSFDRCAGRRGLMPGDAAHKLRHEVKDLMTEEPEPDAFDDLIAHCGEILTPSIVNKSGR